LSQTNARACHALDPVAATLVRALIQAAVVNVDESGVRGAGRLHWRPVAGTPHLTGYGVQAKRGTEARDALGVLPHCRHGLVHDHWKPHYKYDALPAPCNQHPLRALKFLAQERPPAWATQLSQSPLECKDDPLPQLGLDEAPFQRAHARYKAIVRQGRRTHPRRQPGQGRTRRSKAAHRLDRLADCDLSGLAFRLDPNGPFTHHPGEQDLRRIKVKQKISGCFRT
jgi:transposase